MQEAAPRLGQSVMRVLARILVLSAMAGFAGMATAPGQNTPGVRNSPLTSVSDALHAKGIDLSHSSLLEALHNQDAEVRGLAANKLAEDGDADALPAIKEALRVEKDPWQRINMSLALWTLHDANGVPSLYRVCSDASVSIDVVVRVVQTLHLIHQPGGACINPTMRFFETHRDSESRLRDLPALTAIHDGASAELSERIVRLLENLLSDPDPEVRMQASQSLVDISSFSSADAIHAAMLRETDENVRSVLKIHFDQLANLLRHLRDD